MLPNFLASKFSVTPFEHSVGSVAIRFVRAAMACTNYTLPMECSVINSITADFSCIETIHRKCMVCACHRE